MADSDEDDAKRDKNPSAETIGPAYVILNYCTFHSCFIISVSNLIGSNLRYVGKLFREA